MATRLMQSIHLPNRQRYSKVYLFTELLRQRLLHARCLQASGSLAFTTMLSLVPLVTVALTVFGQMPALKLLGETLKEFLLSHVLPDPAGEAIAKYTFEFSQKASSLTAMGTLMLMFAALSQIATIERVFNQIWQVTRPRSFISRMTIYWTALTLGPLILASSIYFIGVLVANLSASSESTLGSVYKLAPNILPALILVAGLAFIYSVMPNRSIKLKHALIGGLFGGIALYLMNRTFGYFISQAHSYSVVYGTFAALPIFLVWLYASWLIVLLGAVLTSVLPIPLIDHKVEQKLNLMDRLHDQLQILAALQQAYQSGALYENDQLVAFSGLDIDRIETGLENLLAAVWIVQADNTWVLTQSLHGLSLRKLLAINGVGEALSEASKSQLGEQLQLTLEQNMGELDEPLDDFLSRLVSVN